MATLSGSFTGPAVTGSVAYAAGGSVTLSLAGEWLRASILAEVSADAGTTWGQFGAEHGLDGLTMASGSPSEQSDVSLIPPPSRVITRTLKPSGAGQLRLRCLEFRSGWCNWTLSA